MDCKEKYFDYIIKKNDTMPYIKYNIKGCDELDLSEDGISVTASMWSTSSLKNKINEDETFLMFKNNYNLEAVEEGDYILIKKLNKSEHTLCEEVYDNGVRVQRAQLSSEATSFGRGDKIQIIKFYEVEAEKEIEYNNSIDLNGKEKEEVSSQNLVYKWREGNTSSPGEFFLEFKVSKIVEDEIIWTKKYPSTKEGISIKITNDSIEI
jgi:hypothetical protein